VVGAAAGYLAGLVMKGSKYNLLTSLVVGVIGALLGGLLLPYTGVTIPGGDIVNQLVTAFVGAILFLFALKVVAKA
jgi:uncharacterized membrane protein YeaQ/YmgE (transglycosylase-associated protein family)